MALISGKGPRRVGVITRGIQLWTDPVCTDEELRRLYDGLVMFYGAASVFVVEETTERKRIPYPDPPGELVRSEVGIEGGRQIRTISTDWPTLERALIARRGPLKLWAEERIGGPQRFSFSCAPLLKAVAEELGLPGTVQLIARTSISRMATITYEIS